MTELETLQDITLEEQQQIDGGVVPCNPDPITSDNWGLPPINPWPPINPGCW